jgi:hypothetical protein
MLDMISVRKLLSGPNVSSEHRKAARAARN